MTLRPARSLLVLAVVLAACASPPSQTSSATPEPRRSENPAARVFEADTERIHDVLERLQAIADANDGIRAVGTPGYELSVDAMASDLAALGFSVETPTVGFTGFRELPGATLEVAGRTFAAPSELHALIYAAGGDVEGPIAVLEGSGCQPDDFAGVPHGAIVLTVQGGCFRRDQAINAASAGAAAFVVGYPGRGPDEIYRPTLIDPSGITLPVVSVTDAGASALRAAEGEPAHLVVATERAPATLRNVIAQLGAGPSVVMVGAHLDGVLDGPGINDNGSGVAAVLEVARAVADLGVPDGWAFRIGLWGGEEFGDIGSRAYVESLEDDVVAYLNIDMAGSPNGATLVYDEAGAPDGSSDITAAFEAWLEGRGEPSARVDIGGSSDHFAFAQAGIPIGGLFSGAGDSGSAAQPSASAPPGPPPDACYHLACDDLDNVDVDRVALFAEATLGVVVGLMAGG
jgi:Zn-dependent M28 family amino/carboxypeptidase